MKKVISYFMALSLLAGCIGAGIPVSAAEGVNVPVPTQEEIREYVKNHPFSFSEKTTYAAEATDTTPGVLSEASRTDALNALNVMRYISGLEEVQLNETFQEKTEAAAWLFKVSGKMSHSPTQPANVSDTLYQLGFLGANSSNIGWGYHTLPDAVLTGWIWDGGVATLGHRRWTLNPGFTTTGFGFDSGYCAMYVTGQGEYNSKGLKGISFPAQNMPVEYFKYDVDWSISLNTYVNPETVSVTLTRNSDGQSWTFDQSSGSEVFSVDNSDYLGEGFIEFNPSRMIKQYQDGDSYTVTVNGLSETVSYPVNFFALNLEETQETTEQETETSRLITYLMGDVNHNDYWDMGDIVLLQKYLMAKETLTYVQYAAADMNFDGKVNIYDFIALKRKLM